MQTFEVEIKLIVHAQRAGDTASPAERRSVNGPLRVPPKVFRVRGNVLTYVSCRRGVGPGLSVIKHCQMLPSHRRSLFDQTKVAPRETVLNKMFVMDGFFCERESARFLGWQARYGS